MSLKKVLLVHCDGLACIKQTYLPPDPPDGDLGIVYEFLESQGWKVEPDGDKKPYIFCPNCTKLFGVWRSTWGGHWGKFIQKTLADDEAEEEVKP